MTFSARSFAVRAPRCRGALDRAGRHDAVSDPQEQLRRRGDHPHGLDAGPGRDVDTARVRRRVAGTQRAASDRASGSVDDGSRQHPADVDLVDSPSRMRLGPRRPRPGTPRGPATTPRRPRRGHATAALRRAVPLAPSRTATPARDPRSHRRRPTTQASSTARRARRTSTPSTSPSPRHPRTTRSRALGRVARAPAHATDTPTLRAVTRPPRASWTLADVVGYSSGRARRTGEIGGRAVRTWLSGRASPCQGEGRGFESRRPLGGRNPDRLASRSGLRSQGGVAERRGSGLQSRIRGFESHLHLEALPGSPPGDWRSGSALP